MNRFPRRFRPLHPLMVSAGIFGWVFAQAALGGAGPADARPAGTERRVPRTKGRPVAVRTRPTARKPLAARTRPVARTRPAARKRPAARERPAARKPSPAPITKMSRADLDRRFSNLKGKSLKHRLKAWGKLFLGTPYYLDPLGEGPTGRHDTDPLMDFGRVDCMSFVEQVMALAYSRNMSETLKWLLRLRYKNGRADFQHRHYTMVNGWILQNIKAGFLKDITRRIGRRRVRTLSANLDARGRWYERHRKRFKLLGSHAPRGIARIRYIPLRKAIGMANRFPGGTLMHIVSELSAKSPYLVTHVGLVIRKGRKSYFRHASRSPKRLRVEDRSVRAYLRMLKRYYGKAGRRRVIGVYITRILPPSRN